MLILIDYSFDLFSELSPSNKVKLEIEIVIKLDFFNKLNKKRTRVSINICIQILLLVVNESGSFFTDH